MFDKYRQIYFKIFALKQDMRSSHDIFMVAKWTDQVDFHIFAPKNYEVKENFSEISLNFSPLKFTCLGKNLSL